MTTSTAPAAWAGAVAVIWVAELTVKDVAGVPPKVTAVAPVKFVPVIVTVVPPAVAPELGVRDTYVGAAVYVKLLVFVAVPAGAVTTTSTVPAACAGVTAVICVAESTVYEAAATPPNVTAVAPVK